MPELRCRCRSRSGNGDPSGRSPRAGRSGSPGRAQGPQRAQSALRPEASGSDRVSISAAALRFSCVGRRGAQLRKKSSKRGESMGNNVKGTSIIKGLGFDSFGLGSNACTVDIDEEQDKILRIRPFHFDEHYTPEQLNAWKIEARGTTFEPGFKTLMSPLSLCYKKRVYSKNRIPYPLRRVDWDPERRTPSRRRAATSGYVRISWDEAGGNHSRREIKRMHDAVQPRGHPVRDRRPRRDEGRPCRARLPARSFSTCAAASPCQSRQPDSWEGLVLGRQAHLGHGPAGPAEPAEQRHQGHRRERRRRAVLGLRPRKPRRSAGAATWPPACASGSRSWASSRSTSRPT